MSDYKGAALMIDALPPARTMLGDQGYDADWFRAAHDERGMVACIPSKANCKVLIPHGTVLYRQLHRSERMSGRLKNWRRASIAGMVTLPVALAGCDKKADAPQAEVSADAMGEMPMSAETKMAKGSGTVTAID